MTTRGPKDTINMNPNSKQNRNEMGMKKFSFQYKMNPQYIFGTTCRVVLISVLFDVTMDLQTAWFKIYFNVNKYHEIKYIHQNSSPNTK